MGFKKGQSGNAKGRPPKNRTLTAILEKAGNTKHVVGGKPVAAKKLMADLLWETTLTPEQRKYLRIFRRAGASLLSLINDILDLSKVESGRLDLDSIDFDLSELIDKTSEMLALRANEKGLELVCHLCLYRPLPYKITFFHNF